MKIEVDVASGWRPTDPRPYDLEVRHDERRAASASPAKRKDSRSKPQRVRALRVIRRYGVPPPLVFDAWLDPVVARLWLFATASRPLEHVSIDPHVNGSFRFVDRGIAVCHPPLVDCLLSCSNLRRRRDRRLALLRRASGGSSRPGSGGRGLSPGRRGQKQIMGARAFSAGEVGGRTRSCSRGCGLRDVNPQLCKPCYLFFRECH